MRATHAGALMPHISTTPETDPFFNNVVLLIHPDATILDRSLYNHTLTIVSTTVSGANPGPSNASAMLNSDPAGSGVTAPAAAAFARTVGEPWTMEWSVRLPTGYSPLANTTPMAWNSGMYHSISAPGGILSITYIDSSSGSYGSFSDSTWYQLCVSYDGTTRYQFVDGNLVASAALSLLANPGTPKFGVFRIPDRADLNSFPGEIAEVRLTMGVCRYTASYTPRSAPFPDS